MTSMPIHFCRVPMVLTLLIALSMPYIRLLTFNGNTLLYCPTSSPALPPPEAWPQ
jgi:hypothetical protein